MRVAIFVLDQRNRVLWQSVHATIPPAFVENHSIHVPWHCVPPKGKKLPLGHVETHRPARESTLRPGHVAQAVPLVHVSHPGKQPVQCVVGREIKTGR